MPEFRIETERLILRDWAEGDWEPFFRHTNTPAVMRWLGGLLDDQAQWKIRERLPLVAQEHGHCFWVVERKADGGHLAGELLGFCGLKRANMVGGPMGDFEIGWRLREDAWARGYAKEAAAASLDAGFASFGAPEIIALTIAENSASWGLMERLGMRRRPELDFRCPDFLPDKVTIAYSIDRDGWNGLWSPAERFPWATILPFEGKAPQIDASAFIAPGARIIGDVTIGPQASIWYNCVLRGDIHRIVVGARSNVQDGCVFHVEGPRPDTDGSPTIVGEDCVIGHMAVVHGATLEDRAFVGMGAVAMDDSRIGDGAMLAAGALLSPGKHIPPGEIWVGRPAKYLRTQDAAQIEKVRFQTERYCRLAQRHMAQLSGKAQA